MSIHDQLWLRLLLRLRLLLLRLLRLLLQMLEMVLLEWLLIRRLR